MEKLYPKYKVNFYTDIYPQIKEIITQSMRAVYSSIDKNRRHASYELYGYDLMIDDNFKVYLIEANINPCMGVTSTFSARYIPMLLENVFK